MRAKDEDADWGRVVNYGVQSAGGSIEINRSAIGHDNTVSAAGADHEAVSLAERVAAVRAALRHNEAAFAEPTIVDDDLTAIEDHLGRADPNQAYLGGRLRQILQAFQVAGIVAAPVAALAETVQALAGG